MGAFETHIDHPQSRAARRSVLLASVGEDGRNLMPDLRMIATVLAAAGLLNEDAYPGDVREAVLNAVRHAGRIISDRRGGHRQRQVLPGDDMEKAFRRALAQGRFPLAHRPVPAGAGAATVPGLIKRGTARANARNAEMRRHLDVPHNPLGRALLPPISCDAFQTNRRLVAALQSGGEIPGLAGALAETINNDGKRGFVNARDFWQVLQRTAPARAAAFATGVTALLDRCGKRRFQKICSAEPPLEADFDGNPYR